MPSSSEVSPRKDESQCMSVSELFAKDFLSQECLHVFDEASRQEQSKTRRQSSPEKKSVSISSNVEEVRVAADSRFGETSSHRSRITRSADKKTNSHRYLTNRGSVDCHQPMSSLADICEASTSVSYLPFSPSLDEEASAEMIKRFKSTDSVMEKFKRSLSISSIMRTTGSALSASSSHRHSSLSNSHRTKKKTLSQSRSINDENLCLQESHSSVSGYNSRSGISSDLSATERSSNV